MFSIWKIKVKYTVRGERNHIRGSLSLHHAGSYCDALRHCLNYVTDMSCNTNCLSACCYVDGVVTQLNGYSYSNITASIDPITVASPVKNVEKYEESLLSKYLNY